MPVRDRSGPGRRVSSGGRAAAVRWIVVTIVVALVAACGSSKGATASGPPAKGKGATLTVGLSQDVTDFSPFDRASQNYPIIQNLYDTLVRYTKQLTPEPGLATQWTPSADGMSLTLKLRAGVKFQDGTLMTAEDVVKNFAFGQDPATCANLCSITAPITNVTAPDSSTVQLTFKAPLPTQAMTDILLAMPVVEPSAMGGLATRGVGTGPFKFVSWIPKTSITLAANPYYWGTGGPYPRQLVFDIFANENAEVAALQTGTIDGIAGLSPQSASALKSDFNIVLGYPGTLTWELRINTKAAPLDNEAVRQSLQYSVDRQGIVKNVLFGFSTPAVSPFGPGSPAYDPSLLTKYAFDPTMAKQILAGSGVAHPSATLLFSTGIDPMPEIAQVLQADFAQIGWTITLQPADSTTYVQRTQSGDWQLLLSASSNANKYPTGIAVNSIYRTAKNPGWPGGVPPQAYVGAINTLNSTLDPAVQAPAFTALSGALVDDPWTISIARWETLFVFKKSTSPSTTCPSTKTPGSPERGERSFEREAPLVLRERGTVRRA
jgi:peptide/nickel transport system substrate-binding protein